MKAIQKVTREMSKEEIQKIKDLDWEGYYSELGEVDADVSMTMCSCGAILVKGLEKCWKCGEEK